MAQGGCRYELVACGGGDDGTLPPDDHLATLLDGRANLGESGIFGHPSLGVRGLGRAGHSCARPVPTQKRRRPEKKRVQSSSWQGTHCSEHLARVCRGVGDGCTLRGGTLGSARARCVRSSVALPAALARGHRRVRARLPCCCTCRPVRGPAPRDEQCSSTQWVAGWDTRERGTQATAGGPQRAGGAKFIRAGLPRLASAAAGWTGGRRGGTECRQGWIRTTVCARPIKLEHHKRHWHMRARLICISHRKLQHKLCDSKTLCLSHPQPPLGRPWRRRPERNHPILRPRLKFGECAHEPALLRRLQILASSHANHRTPPLGVSAPLLGGRRAAHMDLDDEIHAAAASATDCSPRLRHVAQPILIQHPSAALSGHVSS